MSLPQMITWSMRQRWLWPHMTKRILRITLAVQPIDIQTVVFDRVWWNLGCLWLYLTEPSDKQHIWWSIYICPYLPYTLYWKPLSAVILCKTLITNKQRANQVYAGTGLRYIKPGGVCTTNVRIQHKHCKCVCHKHNRCVRLLVYDVTIYWSGT